MVNDKARFNQLVKSWASKASDTPNPHGYGKVYFWVKDFDPVLHAYLVDIDTAFMRMFHYLKSRSEGK